ALRGHLPARFPARAGRGGHGRLHDRGHQPGGGHPLRLHRPAHPTDEVNIPMATIVARSAVSGGPLERVLRGIGRAVREAPLLAVVILGGLVLVAALAGVIAPYDPTLPVPGGQIFTPPFWMEGGTTLTPLGTDFQGRDILSRL